MSHTADRVKETSTTTGTGNLTLAGAASGYITFNSAFGTATSCYYTAVAGTEWEVGLGHLSSSNVLVRDTVLSSSNSGALVNFSAGTKDVFNTVPAQLANGANLGRRFAIAQCLF